LRHSPRDGFVTFIATTAHRGGTLSDTVIEAPEVFIDSHLRVQWLSADHGLWVATGLSERNTLMHLGRIDLAESRYSAYDRVGGLIGAFETLGEAKAHVELHS
jgi:hypothetical protein